MKTRSDRRYLSAGLLAAALSLAGAGSPGATVTASDFDLPLPLGFALLDPAPPTMARAAEALLYVARARALANAGDASGALAELDKADLELNALASFVPTARVKRLVRVAETHLGYEPPEKVANDLDAIGVAAQALAQSLPEAIVQEHLRAVEAVRRDLEQGDVTAARSGLTALRAAVGMPEVDLPLRVARHQISLARVHLSAQRGEVADANLEAAEDEIVILSIGADEPLLPAASALSRAASSYRAGSFERATEELEHAMSALEKAAQASEKKSRELASGLLGKARGALALVESRADLTAERLADLAAHARALAERALAFHRGRGWSSLPPARQMKHELADARLHLIRAETDEFSKWAPEDRVKVRRGVEQELRTAELFLEEALVQAPAAGIDKRGFESAVQEIVALRESREAMGERTRYRHLRAAIWQLMESL